MTERIDIEINDKISDKTAAKIRTIAKAAKEAESSVTKLKAELASVNTTSFEKIASASSKVTAAKARETSATARLTNAKTREEVANVRNAAATQKAAINEEKLASAKARAATAASRAKTAAIQEEIASSRLASAKVREAAALDQATQAQRLNNRVRQTGSRSSRQSLQQTQNLIFQLNDIVVGLASGQKPLTVLIQQGSQISTIYGPGKGVLGTMRLLGASLATIFVPLAPIIATVAALGLGIVALRNDIRKTTGVAVTFGDTFKAVFQVIGTEIVDGLFPAFALLKKEAQPVFDALVTTAKNALNSVIGLFVFAKNVIVRNFLNIPLLVTDAFFSLVNVAITAVETAANGVNAAINEIIKTVNELAAKAGKGPIFELFGEADLSKFKLELTGAVDEAANIIKEESANINRDFIGEFTKAVGNQAIKNNAAEKAKEQLKGQQDLLEQIKAPLLEYNSLVQNGSILLNQGKISLEEYNNALANSRLATELSSVESALPGFSGDSEIETLQNEQQQRLAVVQQAVEAKILTEAEGAARIKAINEQLSQDLLTLELSRAATVVNNAGTTAGALTDIAKNFAGEQSGIYQGLFAATKAFAIAESLINIQGAVAKALNTPFPANIAAIAQVATLSAGIVSNLNAVKLTRQNRKDGGLITGPGGPRDDKIPVNLSNGEFVVNAQATARNRPLLEAVNDNRPIVAPVGNQTQSFATTGPELNISIENYGSNKAFEVQRLSPSDVRIIARDEARQVVAQESPSVIASDLRNPNSRTSKAISQVTNASRRRV